MRQFRIVHTESSLGWGGQEWRVFLELKWMLEHGHRCWLFASKESEIFERGKKAGFPVVPFTFERLSWPAQLVEMAHFFRRKKIEIVNTHSSRDAWSGGIAARMARIPLIIRSRHIEVDYENVFLARIAFELLPHHVLTTSSRIENRLITELGIQKEKITCLPTGVDLNKFFPRESRLLYRELNLPPDQKIVGMISVLRSWKGHDDFIAAAQLILQERTDVHFVIVGEGPGRAGIEKRIDDLRLQSHVTLFGYREDIPEILASLDMLILPSTAHEGIPQIILQAQAMKKPVIGTRIGGIPEVIEDGQTGLLVPLHDPHSIRKAILTILQNPEEAMAMTKLARQKIEQSHSLEAMGEKLEAIYERYLA